MESFAPIRAIAWAQWRTSLNFFLRAHRGGLAVKWLMGLLWYGAWGAVAIGGAILTSGRVPMTVLERALPGVFFLIFFFWQVFPIVLASQGAFIDMRRLLVYPIPTGMLFLLEVILRVTTAFEVILISSGILVGLILNREIPWWSPLIVLVFMVFNLLLASGVKSLLERLFRKKGVRELLMIVFLLLIIGPQFIVAGVGEEPEKKFKALESVGAAFRLLPWAAAADLALGRLRAAAVASLAAFLGLAYLFARLQFVRSLLLEEGSETRRSRVETGEATLFDRLARLPNLFLLDPIAAMVEKDIRTLARSPRFRLIFMMASTFGAVIWLPQAMRSRNGWIAENYVTMAALYGMLVVGEVVYWNVFGFERSGAQVWFVSPLPFRSVLQAKNMVALFVTLLIVFMLSVIATVLPIKAGLPEFADALSAVLVFLVFVLAGGNLTSVYMPRAVDGEQAWRNNSGKTQFLLLFVYPLLTVPVLLGHMARWASGNYWSYHWVLAISLLIGWCFYSVATETAAEAAEERKEDMVGKLSRQGGPIAGSS